MSQLLSRVVVEEAGTTHVSTTAEEVEAESSTHIDGHFTHPLGQQQIEVTVPWSAEYDPRPEIEARFFELIKRLELDSWIMHSPRNKAPGPSGITFELLRLTGDKFQEQLLAVYSEAWSQAKILAHWTHAKLIPIPKRLDIDGILAQHRPITLLEVSRKLLTMILTARIQRGAGWAPIRHKPGVPAR
ncbi:hypothetical protein GGH96_003246 [Coemansia sp. RSA 1972]|nr:hypothetical protein GGH96_003246 [Coemansia sp. RSA 1972]